MNTSKTGKHQHRHSSTISHGMQKRIAAQQHNELIAQHNKLLLKLQLVAKNNPIQAAALHKRLIEKQEQLKKSKENIEARFPDMKFKSN